MAKFLDYTGLTYLWSKLSTLLKPATETGLGLIKLNPNQNVTLNEESQLVVGGRLGQMTTGTGLFAPNDREPRNVNDYSFVITEAKGVDFATSKSLGVITGSNITLKKNAPAGSTTYEVANNYANRIICSTLVGGYVALNEDWAKANQIAKVLSVQINGADYVPDSSANDSSKNIIITTETSANPDSATSTIRGYGSFGLNGYSNLAVGQNVSIGGNSTGASAVIGASCKTQGNWAVVAGNGHYNNAARSAIFGTNNINNKTNSFLAGLGHDSSNGPSPSAAVGKYSDVKSNTAFAVGVGTSHTARKNALEVLTDGRVKASGTPTEDDDLATKQYVDSAIGGGGLEVKTYGNADFTYEQVLDEEGTVINECVAYSTVSGNDNEPKAVKYGRIVNLCGAFKNVNVRPSNATFVMGKVPSGCEPLYYQNILVQGSTQYKYLLQIKPDGTMQCARYSVGSSAIAVTNNAWLNINATYISAT